MQQPGIEVDLVPAQCHQLTDPQRMAVSHQDQRGIPVTMPTDTSGSFHHGIDFTRHQMLPTTALGIGNCSGLQS